MPFWKRAGKTASMVRGTEQEGLRRRISRERTSLFGGKKAHSSPSPKGPRRKRKPRNKVGHSLEKGGEDV